MAALTNGAADQKPLTEGKAPASNPFTESFGKYVQEQLEYWKVPGLSIAVVDGNETFAEVRQHKTLPVQCRTDDIVGCKRLANITGLRICNITRHTSYTGNHLVWRFYHQSARCRRHGHGHKLKELFGAKPWLVYSHLINST